MWRDRGKCLWVFYEWISNFVIDVLQIKQKEENKTLMGKKLTKKIVVAVALGLISLEPLASAHIENIKASGSYTIGDGDENIKDAKIKAKE